MRFLVLSLAVLLGSTSAQHFIKLSNSALTQLQHSDIHFKAAENTRVKEIQQPNSPLRAEIPFGAQLNQRSHSFIRTNSKTNPSQVIDSGNSGIARASKVRTPHVHSLSRKLQPPDENISEHAEYESNMSFSTNQKILQNRGSAETSKSKVSKTEANLNEKEEKARESTGIKMRNDETQEGNSAESFKESRNRSQKINPHSFFDIFWSTKEKSNKLSNHKLARQEDLVSISPQGFQSAGNTKISVSIWNESVSENQEVDNSTSFAEITSTEPHDFTKHSSTYSIFVSNSHFKNDKDRKIGVSSKSHRNSTTDVSYHPFDKTEGILKFQNGVFQPSNTSQQLVKTRETAKLIQSYILPVNRKTYFPPAEGHQRELSQIYFPSAGTPQQKTEQNYLPSINEPEIRQSYLLSEEVKKLKIAQNYLPPRDISQLKVKQSFFPSGEVPRLHVEQSYLPPKEFSKQTVKQSYLPPLEISELNVKQSYLPPKGPELKVEQSYLPPEGPEPKVEQSYLPPEEVLNLHVGQSHLLPEEVPNLHVEQNYLPPKKVSHLKVEQSYFPQEETPRLKVEQSYLPPEGPELKVEQSYLPPEGPELKVDESYLPPEEVQKLVIKQSYLPPEETPELKVEESYLPPKNVSQAKVQQSYLPPEEVPNLHVEQNYLPPKNVSQMTIKQSYLPPEKEPQVKVKQSYLRPEEVPDLKVEQSYLPPNIASERKAYQRYISPGSGKTSLLKLEENIFTLNNGHQRNAIGRSDLSENVSDVKKYYRPPNVAHEVHKVGKLPNRNSMSLKYLPPYQQTDSNIRFNAKPVHTSLKNRKVIPISVSSNSAEFSSYSDYSRSDFSIQNRPFKVAATNPHRDDEAIASLRFGSTSPYSAPSLGTVVRKPFIAKDSSKLVRQQEVRRTFFQCNANDDCKDSELCSSGTCEDACSKAAERCVGYAMCSSRRHVAACVCPNGFSAVSRSRTFELEFDCMPISVLKPERPIVHKNSRVPFFAEQMPPRYSDTGRIASGPIRGSSAGNFRNTASAAPGSVDPCRPSPCGPNTRCDVNSRGIAQCKCLDNFVPDGNTINGCKPQCVSDFECPDDYRCRQTKCERVCVPGACGLNAECDARNHRAVCTCPDGYAGSPDVGCNKNLPVVRANPPAPPPDPCFPSPCGDGAECRERDGRAVCTCPYAYEGDPLTRCTRVECVESSECPSNQACQQQRCINPCTIPDICGRGSECTVRDHQPVCSCGRGFTGDPFVACRRFDPQELCQPSPCGQNTNCRVQNDRAVCSCIDNYIGNPLEGCRAECVSDRDCPGDRTCRENRCVNPCAYGACGENAYCDVRNNQVSCTCPQFFQGDPKSRCFAECTEHDACSSSQACFELRCIDPCVGACGTGADCKVDDHKPICSCPKGFTGHPFESCRPFTEADLCNPNPCGTGADCTPGHDRSGESRPVCTCPVGYIGNPLVSCQRGECQTPNDCPADQTCHAYHCQSACYTETGSPCGELAECSVRNRQPVCSCPPGYSGDPLRACYTAATSRFSSPNSRFHAGRT